MISDEHKIVRTTALVYSPRVTKTNVKELNVFRKHCASQCFEAISLSLTHALYRSIQKTRAAPQTYRANSTYVGLSSQGENPTQLCHQ